MNNNPYRISVIMGIYNCASTLREAIDSLYSQTYKEFKIIMCDDGSTDSTYQIAKEYANQHDNVILIRNPHNMGLNHTLNHCLKYADTEYVARMDGDDISLPTRFEKEIQFLDSHPEYAIVSCPMIYFDESGEFGKGKTRDIKPNKESFSKGTPFCHAPCMVRTIAYKAVGGYTEDKRLLRNEDYNLWAKMYAKGYKGYNLEQHLYAMRDDRNATRRRTLQNRLNSIYSATVAYRLLHFSFLGYLRNISLNIIKIFIPNFLYIYIHRKKLNQKKL